MKSTSTSKVVVVMLDTSACVQILRGFAPSDAWKGFVFKISSVVETELWAGVFHSERASEKSKVQKLLRAVEIVPYDSKAAIASGQVLGTLAKNGIPIGDFDSQIAGHAIANKCPLITANLKHFQRIAQLEIIPWETNTVE